MVKIEKEIRTNFKDKLLILSSIIHNKTVQFASKYLVLPFQIHINVKIDKPL